MSEFQALLAVALVGTSRNSLPTHAGSLLAAELNKITDRDPEGLLLARAAVAGLMEKAGRGANTSAVEVTDPAPAEILPEAPAKVVRHLQSVIGTPMMKEWVDLCLKAGWRVPNRYLPEVLDSVRQDTSIVDQLRSVLGQRAAWLAQYEPAWSATFRTFSEEAWEEATDAQKGHLFRSLRASNLEQAREFFISHVQKQRAKARQNMLRVLAETWVSEDVSVEPILEQLLTDKSQDVREQAHELLQRMPESAYNQRVLQRLTTLLSLEDPKAVKKLQKTGQVTLQELNEDEADLKKDGLSKKQSAQDCLNTLIYYGHPQVLEKVFDCKGQDLVNFTQKLYVHDRLIKLDAHKSLIESVFRTNYTPLIDIMLKIQDFEDWDARYDFFLEHASRETVLFLAKKSIADQEYDLTRDCFERLREPWEQGLSQLFLEAIKTRMKSSRTSSVISWQFRESIRMVSFYADVETVRGFSVPEAEYNDHDLEAIHEFENVIKQRLQMHEDFQAALREASA